jgi:ankyrin repeat protein
LCLLSSFLFLSQTPLHVAAALGHDHVCRVLLAEGADPMLRNYTNKPTIELVPENLREDFSKRVVKHIVNCIKEKESVLYFVGLNEIVYVLLFVEMFEF